MGISLASDEEDYYESMMEELLDEGKKLLNIYYYDPTTIHFSRTSQSRVLAVVRESIFDNEEALEVSGSQTTPFFISKSPECTASEKTLLDMLNDKESEKFLNFFRTGIPYDIDLVRISALAHLSQFIKNNDFETMLALTFFLNSVFNSPNLKLFNFDAFKDKLLEFKTSHSQKQFIEAETENYVTLGAKLKAID